MPPRHCSALPVHAMSADQLVQRLRSSCHAAAAPHRSAAHSHSFARPTPSAYCAPRLAEGVLAASRRSQRSAHRAAHHSIGADSNGTSPQAGATRHRQCQAVWKHPKPNAVQPTKAKQHNTFSFQPYTATPPRGSRGQSLLRVSQHSAAQHHIDPARHTRHLQALTHSLLSARRVRLLPLRLHVLCYRLALGCCYLCASCCACCSSL